MTSNAQIETAKIYQFPVGGRAALTTRAGLASQASELEIAAAPRVAVGGSWYHDAAVQEADKVTNSN
ncbi:MAG TPA: DUF2735 domain-containing protein [Hyphomicrobium sp.]|nr:DUF2735 domain-containing protein [Hyphomicrobium sp.]